MPTDFSKYQAKVPTTSGTTDFSKYASTQTDIPALDGFANAEPNYFQRVGQQFQQAGQDIIGGIQQGAEAYQTGVQKGTFGGTLEATGGLLRSGLRTVGGITGSVFAPILEAPIIKPLTEKIVGKVVENPEVSGLIKSATELSQKYPNASKDLQNIFDIATLGYGKSVEAPVRKEIGNIASDVAQAGKIILTPSEEAVQKKVVSLFNKSIKPTAKKTLAQGQKYENDTLNALKTIKSNTPNLNILDDAGELIEGRTPQTIQELAQGLDQTKDLVFKQYDELAKRAGTQGAVINATPIAEELEKVAQSKALQLATPDVIKYAEDWSKRLRGFGDLDTETTQEVIKIMNNNLQSFYKNPSYDTASKVGVDALIANNFRKSLDNAIENATGEQYQVLKNQYSALKSIENDVVRASMREARKNSKGLIDYTDIFTSGQMIAGITSLNPAMFTKGAIERGFKEYIKFLNDPNRAIKNIFDKIDTGGSSTFNPTSETGKFLKNPKLGMSIQDVTKDMKAYKGEKDLTTKILKDLEGKTTVSKQYILDATNRGELKQVERDLIRQALESEGNTVNVSDFAKKVKAELLPLKVSSSKNAKDKLADMGIVHEQDMDGQGYFTDKDGNYLEYDELPQKAKNILNDYSGAKYENVALPSELRGNVKNYSENVYQSPIKTSAGNVHFSDLANNDNYFGHTRIEDMADNKTRRVIEVQSDLYQKGNLEKEMPFPLEKRIEQIKSKAEVEVRKGNLTKESADKWVSEMKSKVEKEYKQDSGALKLQQYNDPTAHFRMIREEIKKASQDGKTKLQFPTGETAMKIEGLGENSSWADISNYVDGDEALIASYSDTLSPQDLKVGQRVSRVDGNIGSFDPEDSWIITDVLGDGKFKAVPKIRVDQLKYGNASAEDTKKILDSVTEQFDISGKVDTNNPIYKFYEKEVSKYLNKFGGKRVVDDKGVSWIEVPITKEQGKMPVEAFGLVGALGLGAYSQNK